MYKTKQTSFNLLALILSIIFSSILVISIIPPSAKPTHNTISLTSKWTWDEPNIDGTFDPLWSICSSYSYSIFSREGGNQTFWLKFLNNENYLFIAISWSDNEVVQGESLRFYFDENHDGALISGAEECRLISRSLSMWSMTDRHYGSGSWVTDTKYNGSMDWLASPTQIEVQIPIGENAEEFDLNSTFAGDIIGFNIIATDSDFIESLPGYQSTTTEVYGSEMDPTVWANLELASKPVLDFDIFLETSSTIVDLGEVFYITCFISNNANSTGIIRSINATIILPIGLTLAPTLDISQFIDDLSSASTHGSGYNHTFIWTLIALNTGTQLVKICVDGVGIPQLSNETQIEIIATSPEIYLISPMENEPLTETFKLQVGINSPWNLTLTQYSLDGQITWETLFYNGSSSLYETFIDLGSITENELSILAADEKNRVTILTLNLSSSQLSSQTIRITIDNTPPVINVINPQNNSVVNEILTLQVLLSDNVGVEEAMFRLDQEPWTNLTYNDQSGYYEYDLDTTLIADGNHTLVFRASDTLGNTHSQDTIIECHILVSNPAQSTTQTSTTTTSRTMTGEEKSSTTVSVTKSTPGFVNVWGVLSLLVITLIIGRLSQKRQDKSL